MYFLNGKSSVAIIQRLKFILLNCEGKIMSHLAAAVSPKLEADQKMICLLYGTELHYRVYSSPTLDPVLSHMNPMCTLMLFTLILSSHRSLGFTDVSFQAVRLESLWTVIWLICTIFYEIFLVKQPRQGLKVFGRVRDWLRPSRQVVAGGLIETKAITRCL